MYSCTHIAARSGSVAAPQSSVSQYSMPYGNEAERAPHCSCLQCARFTVRRTRRRPQSDARRDEAFIDHNLGRSNVLGLGLAASGLRVAGRVRGKHLGRLPGGCKALAGHGRHDRILRHSAGRSPSLLVAVSWGCELVEHSISFV